ncbi:B-4DMT family transporter [Crossiella sp. CA198]|uniref:B-4DMT family transporter n=1 Tax=Crossiella sp. CA198 TaxID=3455607 RepID=UPI003F8D3EFB
MRSWVWRGLVLAVLHAAAQTAVAAIRVHNPPATTLTQTLTLGFLVALVLAWGTVDGRRRPACAMTWFYTGLLAGPIAGLLGVLAQSALVDATGLESLGTAMTGGAAFTALLIAGPALLGTLLGRRPQTPAAQPPGPA